MIDMDCIPQDLTECGARLLIEAFESLQKDLEQKKETELEDAVYSYDPNEQTMALKTARGIMVAQQFVSKRIETLQHYINEQKPNKRGKK